MMLVPLIPWIASIAAHVTLAAALLLPAGGMALQEGAGDDAMLVEQGIAIEGFAKLGEDEISMEEVEATPLAAAVPQPVQEVKPIDELPVVASAQVTEQETVKAPDDIEDVKDAEPQDEAKEVEEDVVEQPLPPQVAAVQQDSVIAMRKTSAQELRGDAVTARSAYLGTLSTHIDEAKINPRTRMSGTAIVRFKVNAAGELLSREIATSSGQKALDQAALASIDRAAPFPAMPKDMPSEAIEISVPFRFSVR
jgi:protein TonB